MWLMVLGKGGWCSYQEGEDAPLFVLRFEEQSGRLSVMEIHVQAGVNMSGALRDLPLRRLEAMARGSAELRAAIREGREDAASFTGDWLDAVAPERNPEWLSTRNPPTPHAVRPGIRYSLLIKGAQERGKRPDDFYRRVANVHAYVVARKGFAKDVADANRVPVSTVYRWLKEARRRGLAAEEEAEGVRDEQA